MLRSVSMMSAGNEIAVKEYNAILSTNNDKCDSISQSRNEISMTRSVYFLVTCAGSVPCACLLVYCQCCNDKIMK